MAKKTEDNIEQVTPEIQKTGDIIKDSAAAFRAEKKVPMYLAPLYRPYFGNNMRVMINGVSIFFPVDGKTYEIPESFAIEIARRRVAIDEIVSKQGKMANIAENVESNPGELELF